MTTPQSKAAHNMDGNILDDEIRERALKEYGNDGIVWRYAVAAKMVLGLRSSPTSEARAALRTLPAAQQTGMEDSRAEFEKWARDKDNEWSDILDAHPLPTGKYPYRTELAFAAFKAARQPAAVPEAISSQQAEGWVLVPREPTPEMLEASEKSDREYTLRNFGDIGMARQGPWDTYITMIAAAPSAPTGERAAGLTEDARDAARWRNEAVKEMIERLKESIEEFNGHPRDLFAEALTMLLALSQQAAVSRRLAIEEAAKVCEVRADMEDGETWPRATCEGLAARIRALSPTLDLDKSK